MEVDRNEKKGDGDLLRPLENHEAPAERWREYIA